MKRLGTALHLSAQGKLILKIEAFDARRTKLGSPVYTKTNRKIGWLHDVMGPVRSPYAAVRVQRGVRAENLVGQRLYTR